MVAADGPRSQTRASWGIGTWRIPYRQGCLTAKVILRGTVPGTAYELFRPEGPLAVLPLGGETYQVVWSAPFSRCQQRAELPVGEFLDQLAAVLPPGLEPDLLLDRPGAFAQEWMLARRFRRRAGVLIGEAAHRCHPVGGQGLNLCWRMLRLWWMLSEVGLPSQRALPAAAAAAVLTFFWSDWRRMLWCVCFPIARLCCCPCAGWDCKRYPALVC